MQTLSDPETLPPACLVNSIPSPAPTLKMALKLVRSRMPEIIRSQGLKCNTSTLTPGQHRYHLLRKLMEEATEILGIVPASSDCSRYENLTDEEMTKLMEELADVRETCQAIIHIFRINPFELEKIQDKKRFERGGLFEPIFMESYETRSQT